MFTLPDKFNRHTVYFDVDDTLVEWVNNCDQEAENAFVARDSLGSQLVRPITNTVECLKRHKERGDVVVIWSQGGAEWAKAVVEALSLGDYVDACLGKPTIYYDDLHIDQWGIVWINQADPTDLTEPQDLIDE